jgi:hypothetical protein
MFTNSKLDDFESASHQLSPIRLSLNDAVKRLDGVSVRIN